MGSISFSKGTLNDHFHEVLGFKSGLALSVEQLADLANENGYADYIINSEIHGIRLRSENYEDIYYHLLHKVGVTEKVSNGAFDIFKLGRELAEKHGGEFAQDIFKIYSQGIEQATKKAQASGAKLLDPSDIMYTAHAKYGAKGSGAIMSYIETYDSFFKNSPHQAARFTEWSDIISLDDLFKKFKPQVTNDIFFDQRYINFLSTNHNKLGSIHWRKFEELTAEYFVRQNFNVEIGAGSNDDGVDVRAWKDGSEASPEYIIQCKRHKTKIDKVTIKGLYADVLANDAQTGLLVTSSEFSPGARATVDARGYPIEEVNNFKIKDWLQELRVPGSGILRV